MIHDDGAKRRLMHVFGCEGYDVTQVSLGLSCMPRSDIYGKKEEK